MFCYLFGFVAIFSTVMNDTRVCADGILIFNEQLKGFSELRFSLTIELS